MKWLNNLERKARRFAIPRLMIGLSAIMLGVFLADWLLPELRLSSWLYLDMGLVAQGQIWRLITFIFLPPPTSILWILFNLYFYCLIGTALERQWGSFKFNIYYLTGMVFTIIGALFTGFASNFYLNLSLFLAFAMIFPNFEVLIFFLIPVKVKYLAIIDAAFLLYQLIVVNWDGRVAIIMSLLNVALFFGGDFIRNIREQAGYWKTRRNFRKNYRR